MANKQASAGQLLTTPRVLARYVAKIEQRENGCWDWTAATGAGGYGSFKVAPGFTMQAHRIAHWLYKGDPTGHLVLHSCNRPVCCNPEHLRLGTHAENMEDRRKAAVLKTAYREHSRAPETRQTRRNPDRINRVHRLFPKNIAARMSAQLEAG